MDDEPENDETPRPPKPSLAPSWVMLGFLLGAATVWLMQRGKEPVAPAVPLSVAARAVKVEASPVTTIEAVFAAWGQHAVWDKNLTEVAMWRAETGAFSEFYEVRKEDDAFYFRSIPKLTRRIIRRGTPLPDNAPLQFTESEAQYREWLAHGREERPAETKLRPMSPSFTPVPPPETPRAELPPKS
jgi:hypothetical protein